MATQKPQQKLRLKAESKTLKKFVDAGKSKYPLITAVDRHILTRPIDTSRRTDVLHPSEIVSKDWCHRASYFMSKGEYPAPDPYGRKGLRTTLIFAEGHSIHHRWQSWFKDMGILYGNWYCYECSHKWTATSPEVCLSCSSRRITYSEVPVIDTARNIEGKADGILTTTKNEVLEIKSMGPGTFLAEDKSLWISLGNDYDKAWKSLQEPFLKHNMQAQLYLHLLQDLTDITPPESIAFIYESKPNQEVKEFHVARDTALIQHILDAADMIAQAVKDNVAPECNIHGSWKCWRCGVYE